MALKKLRFTIRHKAIALLGALLCTFLHASNPASYDWALSLREDVQPVPHVTESPVPTSETRPVSPHATQDAWPWGSPKNLLNPITDYTTSSAKSNSRTNKRLGRFADRGRDRGQDNGNSSSNATNNNSITLNINKDGEEEQDNPLPPRPALAWKFSTAVISTARQTAS